MIKLATILALLLSSTAQAANIDIQWAIQSYPSTTAQVGDTITFTWGSGHTVNIYPSGTCDSQGAILISETPPATYTFTAADVNKDLFFACGVSGHCEAGQHITVSVTASGTEDTTPAPAPLESETEVPAPSPMEGSTIPSPAPIATGGYGTPAPNTSDGNGSSSATRVPMTGVASAMLAMALVWWTV